MKTEVYLSLGSNLGNRKIHLSEAIRRLSAEAGRITDCSSLYETESWGYRDKSLYLNQVVRLETEESPMTLQTIIHAIETSLGRKRSSTGYEARTLDIDILLYGQTVLTLPLLQIPHPRMHLRKFVLIPLCEIAPKLIHPVFQKSMQALLLECEDELSVSVLQEKWR